MFSGIVEATGKIVNMEYKNDCINLTIQPYKEFNDTNVNDSVAVNGVCLTVTQLGDATFSMTIVPETLRVTNLGSLTLGSEVNLERSVKWSDRISGHCVQGHVDGVAEIIHLKQEGDALLVTFSFEERLAKFLVKIL
jgi:riboflavin synthase